MNRRHRRTTRWQSKTALALVSALLLVLTGCTSAVQQARSENANAAVREGGTLRAATSLDLAPATFYQGQPVVLGLVYDRLIDYHSDSLTPQPSLATSWQVSPDGRTATLELREDVQFHDGRPFTSADVEFNLRTYADPAHVGQLARTAQAISGYDTSAPHRIVLTLAHPVSNLFDLFSIVPIIDSATAAQRFTGEKYNGTGASSSPTGPRAPRWPSQPTPNIGMPSHASTASTCRSCPTRRPGRPRFTGSAVPAGRHALEFRFHYDGDGWGAGGLREFWLDGIRAGSGRLERTVPFTFSTNETTNIRIDRGSPVTEAYAAAAGNPFTGRVHSVTLVPGLDAVEIDAEQLLRVELARQ